MHSLHINIQSLFLHSLHSTTSIIWSVSVSHSGQYFFFSFLASFPIFSTTFIKKNNCMIFIITIIYLLVLIPLWRRCVSKIGVLTGLKFEDVGYIKPSKAFKDDGHKLTHVGFKEGQTILVISLQAGS